MFQDVPQAAWFSKTLLILKWFLRSILGIGSLFLSLVNRVSFLFFGENRFKSLFILNYRGRVRSASMGLRTGAGADQNNIQSFWD